MFSNIHSKSKLFDSNSKGGYNNNNFTDYFDAPLSSTSPAIRVGGLARDGSDLYEPIQGQGSIKYASPNPYMRNQGSKSISSQLSPLKANADIYMNARDKFNRSQVDDIRAIVGENQYAAKNKPRAMSQLKTSQYGSTGPSKIEMSGILLKKNSLAPLGNKTPMPNKNAL